MLSTVKSAFRSVGIEVARYRPASAKRATLFQRHGIASVVDAGANRGQYAREIRAAGFSGAIVSIEPQTPPFRELQAAATRDPLWSALQCAVGDVSGEERMHVAAGDAASSLLTTTDLVRRAAPGSRQVDVETVSIRRLDEISEVRALDGPMVLKCDLQGYELRALRGAEGLFGKVSIIECETSLRPLYEGQPLLPDVIAEVATLGFQLDALEPGFYDPVDGTILQFDAFFSRAT